MKALLYADWCTLKGVIKNYPLPVIVVTIVATATGFSDVEPLSDAVSLHVHSTVVATASMMLAIYGFFAFFAVDEREGWEAMRLGLPVTRNEAVRARYVTMLALVVALGIIANLTGIIAGALVSLFVTGEMGFMPWSEAVMLSGVITVTCLVYFALMMPLMFKLGLSKARLWFSMPFMLCLLFTLDPVREVANGVYVRLVGLAEAIGSPFVLLAGTLLATLVLYAASIPVSERIYASRDF